MRQVQIASAGVRRSGFTLVEMLAVIGIIVLLVGILLPTIMSARRNAERNAVRMELQTIALALEAYKADFGDYPRPPSATATQRKYRLLAWALVGPYDATTGVADPLAPGNTMTDGADGPGFRTVFDKSFPNKGGKVWGPYLAPDKFRVATSANNLDFPTTPADLRWDILDRYGSPIEYFPRWRNYQAGSNLFGLAAGSAATAVYDFQQQFMQVATGTPASGSGPMNYLRKALGDDDLNDVINGAETIKETPPFLLLSRGPLRAFSTTAEIKDPSKFPKTEEITNLQH